jgi:immune inhibitor A
MHSPLLRLLSIWLLVCILLAGACLPVSAQAAPGNFQPMPPHPRLYDRIARGEIAVPRTDDISALPTAAHRPQRPGTSTLRALAVLVDFSDNAHTVTASFFDSLIFAAPVAGRGSVRDYFADVSYGQIDLVTLNLPSSLGWQRAPQTYDYYVNGEYCVSDAYPRNCQKLAEDIVAAIDGVVDFSQYDTNSDGYMEPLMIMHAGGGAEYTGSKDAIWSHSSTFHTPAVHDGVTINQYVIMPEEYPAVSGYARHDMTVGVITHEMGHGFWGLPDLYDRDYTSAGIGEWSLMAGGSWNGSLSLGESPSWPDAWSRIQMGIATPTNVTTNGPITVPQAYNNPTSPTVFKLKNSQLGSQEYFLVENRQQTSNSYDEYLPGQGLLIWHVDEAKAGYSDQNDDECTTSPDSTCGATHFLVAMEQADGLMTLENNPNARGDTGDPFPGSTNKHNWNIGTTPPSASYYSAGDKLIALNNISDCGTTMTANAAVSAADMPYHVFLPILYRAAPPTTWTTITSLNFESGLGGWQTGYNGGAAPYAWAARTCRAYAGGYGGWSIGTSTSGAPTCSSNYPDNADSWLIFGPFDLRGVNAAKLSFKLWLNTETYSDMLCRLASSDGAGYNGYCTSGSTNWTDKVLDLGASPTNMLGQAQVWVALQFESDATVNMAEGAYVDDVVLAKCVGTGCAALAAPAAADQTVEMPVYDRHPAKP